MTAGGVCDVGPRFLVRDGEICRQIAAPSSLIILTYQRKQKRLAGLNTSQHYDDLAMGVFDRIHAQTRRSPPAHFPAGPQIKLEAVPGAH
jgi:hypothetical protein